MKRTKFTEGQIIGILKEQHQGKKVTDICRDHGISQPTFYQWKSNYSGLDVQHLKKMKEMEVELAQYKKIVAEQVWQITLSEYRHSVGRTYPWQVAPQQSLLPF